MSVVPTDEPRITTGEPTEPAEHRKSAGSSNPLPDESDVAFLDDRADDPKVDDDERDGGSR